MALLGFFCDYFLSPPRWRVVKHANACANKESERECTKCGEKERKKKERDEKVNRKILFAAVRIRTHVVKRSNLLTMAPCPTAKFKVEFQPLLDIPWTLLSHPVIDVDKKIQDESKKNQGNGCSKFEGLFLPRRPDVRNFSSRRFFCPLKLSKEDLLLLLSSNAMCNFLTYLGHKHYDAETNSFVS